MRKVVVLGDSAAAGHGLASADEAWARQVGRALHAADGRATTVRTVAVDGATTATVATTQLHAVRGAEVVLIGVGVNDALRGQPVRHVRDDLLRLLRGVRSRTSPTTAIVLLSCPDLSAAPGLPPLLRPVVGWRCRAVARAQQRVAKEFGVALVPESRTSMPVEVFGDDGVHPGAVGHAVIADRVAHHLMGYPVG